MTQEKSFKENFPSLAGKNRFLNLNGVYVRLESDKALLKKRFKKFIHCIQQDVQENCLDKQRVKELIDNKLRENSSYPISDERLAYEQALLELEKELGLIK